MKNFLLTLLAFIALTLIVIFPFCCGAQSSCNPRGADWNSCTPRTSQHYPAMNDLDSAFNVFLSAFTTTTDSNNAWYMDHTQSPAVPFWYSSADNINSVWASGYFSKLTFKNTINQATGLPWHTNPATGNTYEHDGLIDHTQSDNMSYLAYEDFSGNVRSVFKEQSGGNVFVDKHLGFSVFLDGSERSVFWDPATQNSYFMETNSQSSAFVDANTGASFLRTIKDTLSVQNDLIRHLSSSSASVGGLDTIIRLIQPQYGYMNGIRTVTLGAGATLPLPGAATFSTFTTEIIIGGYITSTGAAITTANFASGLRSQDIGFINHILPINSDMYQYFHNTNTTTITNGATPITLFISSVTENFLVR